jgi:predicted DsbA family dithiol-disulfide isomerase
MQIEIWSDVACPFCYIGKRHFEAALSRFEHRDDVEVRWRSFQLSPDMPRDVEGNLHQVLAAKLGVDREQAMAMNERVTAMAADAGLHYALDRVVPTNTFDAHRLAQLAWMRGMQDEVVEKLLAAYFTEGVHLGDRAALVRLGTDAGLDAAKVEAMLEGEDCAEEVRSDVADAHELGITAVPTFVFDRRFGISGAQGADAILAALEQAWALSVSPAEG